MGKYASDTPDVLNRLCAAPLLFSKKLSNNSAFSALQRSLCITLPAILLGAFALLIKYPPFVQTGTGHNFHFGQDVEVVLDAVINATFGIASLIVIVSYAYIYTNSVNSQKRRPVAHPLLTILVALTSFFILIAQADSSQLLASLSISQGLPTALFVAVASTGLFIFLCRKNLFRFQTRALSNEAMLGDIYGVLPAALTTLIVFAGLKGVLLTIGSEHVTAELQAQLNGMVGNIDNSLWGGLKYVLLSQVLWLFGVHGRNMLNGVSDLQLIPAADENIAHVAAGLPPTNIITSQVFDLVHVGGSGATLGMIIAMLVFSKLTVVKRFALLALIPALFNVNEPIIYGIPIVLNPLYALPFLLAPLVNTGVLYGAMLLEWMPFTSYGVAWTTPPILNAYAVTGSFSGAGVQAVCLVLSVLIYAPFVRLTDTVSTLTIRESLTDLLRFSTGTETPSTPTKLLQRNGVVGRVARALAIDLEAVLDKRQGLHLEYQPQINACDGSVCGVEALLRWNHPIYGYIAPPVIIQLAEDMEIMPQLGEHILDLACRTRADWTGFVAADFKMSVNVTPSQVLQHDFADEVKQTLARYALDPSAVELEITESTVLLPDDKVFEAIENLRAVGVRFALDDFGMGHTSLRYMQAFPIDTVKIDRSLTRSCHGEINGHILKSIFDLSASLGFATVVEGIETEEEKAWFSQSGCTSFQGYLFSRPLEADDFVAFYIENAQLHAPLTAALDAMKKTKAPARRAQSVA
mgnify:CR=1 FL=1